MNRLARVTGLLSFTLFAATPTSASSSAGAAARVGDNHACPLAAGPTPHVGGPVLGPGEATVQICGKPAAVVGILAQCNGPPDTVVKGSSTVLIGGKPAARVGDPTAHGGTITSGCETVVIGDLATKRVSSPP